MSLKVIFVASTLLYVANASVVTVNVFDDVPETEVADKQKDCNFQACDQLCRSLGFTGGVCVNGRCDCDNFLRTGDEVSATAESLSGTEEFIPIRGCNFRACDQLCRRLGFTGGACVNGRCKCDNFLHTRDEVSRTANTLSDTEEFKPIRGCNFRACDQLCRRLGFTGGVCVNGRCKCDNFLYTEDDVSATAGSVAIMEDSALRQCNFRACDQLCRRLAFTGGACVNDRCKCDNFFYTEPEVPNTAESFSNPDETASLRACYHRECNQRCRRIGFPGGVCVRGRCKCDMMRDIEYPDTTSDEQQESYLVLKSDEANTKQPVFPEEESRDVHDCTPTVTVIKSHVIGELEVPSSSACNTATCRDMCHRLNYAGGMCISGVCQCY